MLKDNIRSLRKEKGLSQEELAVKLNVVRQTVSKWEQGLSVPDAELLVSLAEAFDVPVSTLLGESISEEEEHDHLKEIAEKLEVVNAQLARNSENRRKTWHIIFMAFCIVILAVFIMSISILSKAFVMAKSRSSEAARLSDAVTLASNAADVFLACDDEKEMLKYVRYSSV